jgi:RND family efflux transporter MFP subunit
LLIGGYWRFVHLQSLVDERSPSPSSPQAPEHTNDGKDRVVSVQVASVKEGTIVEEIVVYGTVIPAPGAVQVISVPFESQVRRVFVNSGQRVTVGEKLIEIDASPDTQLQLDEARNTRAVAEQNLRYVQQRFALKLATNDQLLQAQQAAQDARLRLNSLERRGVSAQRTLLADAAGLVSKVLVQEGAIATAGNALLEIVAQDRLEVRLGAEPEDLPRLQLGQSVTLERVNRPAVQGVTGRIRKIARAVNPATRLVDVFVALSAAPELLLDEYMCGRISLPSARGLIVPRAAVLPEEDAQALFTIHDGRARKHRVFIGAENDQEMEITGDRVRAGDLVVVLGNYELHDGMAVSVEQAS